MSAIVRKERKFGVIADTANNKITVILDKNCTPSETCHIGCGACGGNSKIQKATISAESTDTYSIGQKVQISRLVLNENISALVVFGIPVLFSFLCITGWFIYSPQEVESPFAVLSTAISFTIGFPVVWCIDKLFYRKYPPRILPESDCVHYNQAD